MADISKFDVQGTTYKAADIEAREVLDQVQNVIKMDNVDDLRIYTTEAGRPTAIDPDNGVLISTGTRCLCLDTKKGYKATVSGTSVAWEYDSTLKFPATAEGTPDIIWARYATFNPSEAQADKLYFLY